MDLGLGNRQLFLQVHWSISPTADSSSNVNLSIQPSMHGSRLPLGLPVNVDSVATILPT